jgi:hypothetical protein
MDSLLVILFCNVSCNHSIDRVPQPIGNRDGRGCITNIVGSLIGTPIADDTKIDWHLPWSVDHLKSSGNLLC